MPKAVLVTDMPECCDECFALVYNSELFFCRYRCRITGKTEDFKFKTSKQRIDDCPWRELPEKYIMNIPHDRDYDGEYEYGWNACIDEILEGEY